MTSAKNENTDFESMITARIMNLEQENSELKNELKATKVEIDMMKSASQSEQKYGTKNSFDCHLNDGNYTEQGVIRFDGCSGM